MAQINLNLKKSLFTPKAFPYIFDYSHRWEFWYGGAASSKSYSISQKIIIRCCKEKITIAACRRYGSTLRNSCFSLFKEILAKWHLTPYVKIKETDMSIEFPNGSKILHLGLDDEQKLLSINNVGCFWLEEAFEIPKEIIEQINLRMRSKNENQQIIMSWNPISKYSHIYNFVELNPPENSIKLHFTFKDNPFLSQEYIDAMEDMRVRNPAKARIYYYGEYGVNPEGLVITNFRIEEFDAMALAAQGLEHRAGMDIGYVDASAVLDTLYDKDKKTIYIFNEFYRSGCQLSELAAAIKDMNLNKVKLYVDSSEPRSIQFFRNEGINAVGANKGKDSVRAGYMFLQDNLLVIHPRCKNLIRDCENLSYRKSKQTGEYTEEFEDHSYTHTTDSLRYAYSDIYTQTKLKALNKSALGL